MNIRKQGDLGQDRTGRDSTALVVRWYIRKKTHIEACRVMSARNLLLCAGWRGGVEGARGGLFFTTR